MKTYVLLHFEHKNDDKKHHQTSQRYLHEARSSIQNYNILLQGNLNTV